MFTYILQLDSGELAFESGPESGFEIHFFFH